MHSTKQTDLIDSTKIPVTNIPNMMVEWNGFDINIHWCWFRYKFIPTTSDRKNLQNSHWQWNGNQCLLVYTIFSFNLFQWCHRIACRKCKINLFIGIAAKILQLNAFYWIAKVICMYRQCVVHYSPLFLSQTGWTYFGFQDCIRIDCYHTQKKKKIPSTSENLFKIEKEKLSLKKKRSEFLAAKKDQHVKTM